MADVCEELVQRVTEDPNTSIGKIRETQFAEQAWRVEEFSRPYPIGSKVWVLGESVLLTWFRGAGERSTQSRSTQLRHAFVECM